ncbi:hypothetical protein [Pararoseomonas baculiformis]|nr:hypothetical protein [Pararoseomonas baculiformis]
MFPVTHPAQDGPAPLAALLFRPGPALAPEAHRVACALLEDAARRRGGRASADEDGGWRLVAAPPALEVARRTLAAVLHGRDAALVTEALAAPPPPAPGQRGLEAMLATRPIEQLVERRAILGFGAGGMPRPAGWRLRPDRAAIAAALGAGWVGAPWQAHGWELVARRIAALPWPGEGPLHLDLPPEVLPPRGAPPFLPVLPPRALASPPPVPFAVDGPAAAALGMVDPAYLRAQVLHLAYEPALDLLPATFWGLLGPGRVVLEGVEDEAGLRWGLARGIARFSGPEPDRVLAALRRRGG